MDKVTIIIPVYNAEKTIEKCISSVLNQTYKNLEILVIDDGSKDNSFEVIKSIDDPRIKAIKKKNEGVAVTRNKGIKMDSNCQTIIGDNCYFGLNSFVGGNITIGKNVTIGANTVVTKDIPDNAIVGGIPARIIRFK